MTNKTTSLFLKQFAWGVSGGSITGLQNFLKDALTIAKAKKQSSSSSTTEDDEGWPWFLILFIFLAIATAFGGLLLLTACMKRYDATYSSAMFVGSFVVSASIMSAVHYRTFQNLKSVWNYVLYPMGLVVLMVGVFILVQETREHSAEDGDDVNLDGANVLPPLSMSPNDLVSKGQKL
jgi:predicted permease